MYVLNPSIFQNTQVTASDLYSFIIGLLWSLILPKKMISFQKSFKIGNFLPFLISTFI